MMRTEISELEQRILVIAEQQGSVAELCIFVDYYTDVGRVPEHFRVRNDVLNLVRALGEAPVKGKSND